MIWVTDIKGGRVAINEEHVIAVFIVTDGEFKDKTCINLTNGQILVEESDYDIVGQLTK